MSPAALDEKHRTVLLQVKVPENLHALLKRHAKKEHFANVSEFARRLFWLTVTAEPADKNGAAKVKPKVKKTRRK